MTESPPSPRREPPTPEPRIASSMPPPLHGLDDERARLVRILGRLEVLIDPQDLPERADLAHELVRSASRHRDVMDRVVAPAVDPEGRTPCLRVDDPAQSGLVEAMELILNRTKHIDPRNAHAGDSQGLEDAIAVAMDGLAECLAAEDRALPDLLGRLSDDERRRLGEEVASAASHPSQHPKPASSRIGRAVQNLGIRLDHAFEDVATPSHPGAPVVDGPPPQERTNGDEELDEA